MNADLLLLLISHHQKALAECDAVIARLGEIGDIDLRSMVAVSVCRAKAYSVMRMARYAEMEPRT